MDSRESPAQHQQQANQAPPGMMIGSAHQQQQQPYGMASNHHHQHQHHLQQQQQHHLIGSAHSMIGSAQPPPPPPSRFPFNSVSPPPPPQQQQAPKPQAESLVGNHHPYDGSSPPPRASGGSGGGGFSIDSSSGAKKKRGRPRKYSPDGNIALGLAPTPMSSSGGGGHGDSGGTAPSSDPSGAKKHRGRPPGSGKRQLDALGSGGIGFTPHVILVQTGEDIASKVMEFSQQGPRTVCILSANGAICNVSIRQPTMSGGIVSYEGRYEIISLSGSFLLTENNGHRTRTGSLCISLAGSDGRVVGGGVAGSLMAASPVQVIVGSFLADGKKSGSNNASQKSGAAPQAQMLNFGAHMAAGSPPSHGDSSESSEENGNGPPMNRGPGFYSGQQQQQHQQQQQIHNMHAYNMWNGQTQQ